MKYFTAILATVGVICGTVNAANDPVPRSLLPAITAIAEFTVEQARLSVTSLDWNTVPTPETNWSIFQGIVLGLQLNSENEKHQCYQSVLAMKADVEKLPDYLRAVTGQTGDSSSGNTIVDSLPIPSKWQPARYFKMFKRAQELAALFFDIYE
jgi:hypothetical protein